MGAALAADINRYSCAPRIRAPTRFLSFVWIIQRPLNNVCVVFFLKAISYLLGRTRLSVIVFFFNFLPQNILKWIVLLSLLTY